MPSRDEVQNRFFYHPPTEEQAARHQVLSEGFAEVARLVLVATPESREQSLALTKLEEAKFFASAAIARRE